MQDTKSISTHEGAINGRASHVSSSLVPLEINRNSYVRTQTEKLAAAKRGKHCGRFTVEGNDDSKTLFVRVDCKKWDCNYCGPRKAAKYKQAIRDAAEKHRLHRFVTLTLDPKRVTGEPVQYLRGSFDKLRSYLRRRFGAAPRYIAVLEFQPKSGQPHLHILIDRYIEHAWLKQAWAALGGGFVDIRFVDLHRVSRYLAKYLTKELLLSAPKRSRRVTTSRGVTLLEKASPEIVWFLHRLPIFVLLQELAACAVNVEYDREKILEKFVVPSWKHAATE